MKKRNFITTLIISLFIIGFFTNINLQSSTILDDKHIEENLKTSNPLIWHYTTGGKIQSISISSDGKYIVAGSNDNKVYLFDNSNSTPLWTFNTGGNVNGIDISSNGNYLAAGRAASAVEDPVYFFEKNSSTPLWECERPYGWRALSISSDGNYLVASTYGSPVYLFEKSSSDPKWVRFLPGSTDAYSLAISSTGEYIAAGSGGYYTKVYFWHKSSSYEEWAYETGDIVNSIAISSDGNYIVAGSDDFNIYYFNKTKTTPKMPIWTYNVPVRKILSVDISSDGKYIVAGTIWNAEDSKVLLFEKSSSIPLWTYAIDVTDFYYSVNSIAISLDGNYIAVACGDKIFPQYGRIYLFSRDSPNPLWMYQLNTRATKIAISSDGKYITAGCDNGEIYLFYGPYSPSEFTLSSDADNPDTDGVFNLEWTQSHGADNYTIYVHDTYITEINNSITKYTENVLNLSYPISGLNSGDYYFKVVSFNKYGNSSSNCIHIDAKVLPYQFILDSNAGNPDSDGNFNLTWSSSNFADNYSVYCHHSYITTINENVTKLYEGIDNLSYSIFGLKNGDYYYMVVAFNEFGNISSNCLHIAVRIPPGPFSLNSDADNPELDGIFNLSWTESAGADNYSIYVSNNLITSLNASTTLIHGNITELNYTITLLNDFYYIVAVAYNESGFTLSNNIFVNVQAPPRPFVLSSDADFIDTDGSYNLYWNISLNADNYSIYVHNTTINRVNESIIPLIEGISDLSFPISGVLSGNYYYVVVAYNQYGNYTSNCIKISVQIPPAPFFLYTDTDLIDTDGSFNLIWEVSEFADNYSIYVHNSCIIKINETVDKVAEGIKNLNYPISGLQNGVYYYMIVAFNKFANVSSNCIEVSVRLSPGSFSLNVDADFPDIDGIINLTWTSSKYADNYSVYIHSNPIIEITGNETLVVEGIINLSYPISGLPNGDYYLVVVAYNKFGNFTSNCIYVQVKHISEQNISFGIYYLLFMVLGLFSIVLIKRRSKSILN